MSARRDRTGKPLAPSTISIDYTNRAATYSHLRHLESLAARHPHDELIGELARAMRGLMEEYERQECERRAGEMVH